MTPDDPIWLKDFKRDMYKVIEYNKRLHDLMKRTDGRMTDEIAELNKRVDNLNKNIERQYAIKN